jgi:HPt (histidine-containing phosphotransfer) domain-containing protein
MDGYIAKPVRAKALRQTIAELVGPRRVGAAVEPAAAPVGGEARVDWRVALQAVQQDQNLLREVVEAFLEEYPRLLAELQTGLSTGNAAVTRRAAHTLKGSLRYFGAQRGCEAAQRLEELSRQERLEEGAESLGVLHDELAAVHKELAAQFAPAAQPAIETAGSTTLAAAARIDT